MSWTPVRGIVGKNFNQLAKYHRKLLTVILESILMWAHL
jgi:hypothetical protein